MTAPSEGDRTPRRGAARFGWVDLVRVWSSAADGRRLRRPTDVLLLAGAVLTLILLGFFAPGPSSVDQALVSLIDAEPTIVSLFWGVSYSAFTLWAVTLLLLPLFFRARRRLTVDFLLAAALAGLGALAAGAVAGTSTQESIDALVSTPSQPVYVAVRVAVGTAVIVAASPHLTRPLRYWGRTVILLAAVSVAGLGLALPIGALAGLVLGIGAAALTHLILGTPQGLLTEQQVEIALSDLGIDVDSAVDVGDEVSGEVLWRALSADRSDLLVKVYGRDAWDTQAVGSLWSALTRRGEVPRLGRSRQSRVEHEALAMLLAERAGCRTLDLLASGQSGQGDSLIVTSSPQTTLAALDEITDSQLDAFWHSLTGLHAVGMTHGRIDERHLLLDANGEPTLADFADANLNAGERDLLIEDVQMLVTTSVLVGVDRALDSAQRVIGDQGLVDLLPYLQPAALGRLTRTRVGDADWTVKDLQKAAIERLDVAAPSLQRLRRVTLKSVAIVALIAVMAYVLIGLFAGVDFASVVDALSSANMAILLVALVLSPTIQMSLAFSTIGSTMAKLSYLPVLMLQYAIQFIALCLPATAARLALEVRFFQRFGIQPTPAVTMGMIDSFSGFIVQISLIILILVSNLPGFTTSVFGNSSSSTTDDSGRSTIAVVAVFAVLALIVTLAVPKFRRRLLGNVPRIRSKVAEQREKAGDALSVVRHPRKVMTMVLGNLGAQVIQAVILGITLAAFGESAALSQLILINTAVSLFNGLMPVPGGMGVAEAGYTAGLQAVGIPAPIAMGTAIAYRLVTFYLPPLWGSVAMRWLRRHEYI